MNHNRIEELLRGDVPSTDAAARERLRRRLQATIDREIAARPRRRPVLAFVAAVASIAVGLLFLQVLLPPGSVGPDTSAAREIRSLGLLSAQQPVMAAGPTDLVYRRYREVRLVAGGSTREEYQVAERVSVESWFASDGSGRRETTFEDVGFVTPEDRKTWQATDQYPLHEVGSEKSEVFMPGELPVYLVEELPADPAELLKVLQDDTVIVSPEGGDSLFSTIGALLTQQNLATEVRLALFEVTAALPGVTVDEEARDPLGRPAIVVGSTVDGRDAQLFFDPADGVFLGHSEEIPAHDGHATFTEWRAYIDSDVVPEADVAEA
jgi:hypothetical protein